MANEVLVCGGDYGPRERDECPAVLHDWPLPHGFTDASFVANSRLNRGWRNKRCATCGTYGWLPGRVDPELDHEVNPDQPVGGHDE